VTRRIGLFFLVLLAAAVLALQGWAVELLPHRAAYEMALADSSRASGLVAAQGMMVYRFGKSCDGWTVENQTVLQLTYDSGANSDTRWTFTSWESADGLGFRFRAKFEEGPRIVEKVEGHARLAAKGGSGSAWLTQPRKMEIPLPAGTLFPTEHMAALIAAATAGETSLQAVVFDGASVDNPYLVNALFGPLSPSDHEAMAKATRLAPLPSWWARLAFFPERMRTALPEFELGARYRADGVADRITQRFEDFALSVQLQEFAVLPAPDC
jgi:hypothetical protein